MIGKLFICVCNLVFELYSELTDLILEAAVWEACPVVPGIDFFSLMYYYGNDNLLHLFMLFILIPFLLSDPSIPL